MKKIIYLLFISLIGSQMNVHAQFNLQWNDIFSYTPANNFSCENRKVLNANNGDLYVIADATSNIDPSGVTTANTYYYVLIRKYNSAGTLLIQKFLEVNNHDVSGFTSKSVFDAALDGSGNVYIGLNFYDPNTGFDVRYVKYNNLLTLQSTFKYNPVGKDIGKAMSVDATGMAFIVCESDVNGIKTNKVLKSNLISQSLDLVFSFDAGFDFLNDIKVDNSQNAYVTGYRLSGTAKSYLTASVASSGILRWKYIFNNNTPTRNDVGTRLAFGNDNCIYVVGSSDVGLSTGSDYDVVIYKHFMPNGKRIWLKREHYGANDQGAFVVNFDATYIYVASTAGSNYMLSRINKADASIFSGRTVDAPKPDADFNALISTTLSDFIITPSLKFYVAGTVVASNLSNQPFSAAFVSQYGFSTGTRFGFLLLDSYRVEGTSAISYTSGDLHINLNTNKIIWLRDEITDYSTHTKEQVEILSIEPSGPLKMGSQFQNSKSTVEVFPNPSSGIINFNATEQISHIQIFDLKGNLVFEVLPDGILEHIDLSHLEQGIYLIKMTDIKNSQSIAKVSIL